MINDTNICEASKQVAHHILGSGYTSEQLERITAFVKYLYDAGFTNFRGLINKAIVAIKNGEHVYYLSRCIERDKKYGNRNKSYYRPADNLFEVEPDQTNVTIQLKTLGEVPKSHTMRHVKK